jgi:hypothetical protein
LTAGAYYGLIRFGKKENVLVRGALLGAVTGFGVAFLNAKDNKKVDRTPNDESPDNFNNLDKNNDLWNFWIENREKILTVALFTGGGVVAGSAVKKLNKKRKK